MICPNCGTKLKVIDVSHNTDFNEDYRRYRCQECGNRYCSIEIMAEDNREFANQFRLHYRKRKTKGGD